MTTENQATDGADKRAEFEQAVKVAPRWEGCVGWGFERLANGAYCNAVLDAMWTGWQLHAAQPAPVALTDERIVIDGLMMVPNRDLLNSADAFEAGVRFAERAHGIPAPQDQGAAK